MPTDALKARIDDFLAAHNTLALATGCGNWVRCTLLEYLRVNGALYILTEGGLKFKGIWWNGAISAAVRQLRRHGLARRAADDGQGRLHRPAERRVPQRDEARGAAAAAAAADACNAARGASDITRYELL